MAMFHLSTKPISRKSGRSATASSAYRSGSKIEDKRTGLTHDYTKKQGVVKSECFLIQDNQKIKLDRSQVWNTAEQKEKRKDSRTAREIIINLPHELNEKQRADLVKDFAESVAKKYNVAIDYSIHLPDKEGDQRNHHCHIMMTTRTAELDKNNNLVLGDKTALELGNKDLAKLDLPTSQEQIKDLRREWAETTNKHLVMAELSERIDHRSHKDRGLITLPTIKLGWQATAMERKGIQTDKGDYNRQIHATNAEINRVYFDIGRLSSQQRFEKMRAEKQQTLLNAQKQALQSDKGKTATTLPHTHEKTHSEQSRGNMEHKKQGSSILDRFAQHKAEKEELARQQAEQAQKPLQQAKDKGMQR